MKNRGYSTDKNCPSLCVIYILKVSPIYPKIICKFSTFSCYVFFMQQIGGRLQVFFFRRLIWKISILKNAQPILVSTAILKMAAAAIRQMSSVLRHVLVQCSMFSLYPVCSDGSLAKARRRATLFGHSHSPPLVNCAFMDLT